MSDYSANMALSCPVPVGVSDLIRLGHGSGGKLTAQLIETVFLPELGNEVLNQLDDAALVSAGSTRLAVTTDAYVVNPIFFPGGDIGKLAVHGTVNDLSMRGAKPLYLAASFILEEGLRLADLKRIVKSMREACLESGVILIAGDTKVVNRGAADKIFITTTGIGVVEVDPAPSAVRAEVGDVVIASGDLGLHGMAIMCAREALELDTRIESDTASLHNLVAGLLTVGSSVHCLRDLTRGGLSSALNEIAVTSGTGIELDESVIPIHPEVQAACEILGLDPLYVASEGRLVAIVAPDHQGSALEQMRSNPLGRCATVIGRVVPSHSGRVVLKSRIGGHRILDKLSGEQLPRIC